MEGTFAPNHTTADGKLCISVNPLTHPQANNPKIIEQIVLVQNICGQSIRVRVCYAGSSDCIVVPLAGYQKLQRLLGIAAGSTNFQFEYRELYSVVDSDEHPWLNAHKKCARCRLNQRHRIRDRQDGTDVSAFTRAACNDLVIAASKTHD
ncbi:hypothetical protein [Bradyrhizobium sp. BR 1432]|uniref:hypothetical protein n=1 Tax=Bradyrhizobium sp. BR 1432 TaxID=3447966 RepID=UPI003EE6C33C